MMLPNGWKRVKLGDVVKMSSGGTPSKDNASFWNGDIPWISALEMHKNFVEEAKLNITEDALKKGSSLAKKNDLLLLTRGSMLWKRIPVCLCLRDVAFNQDVKCLHANEKLNSTFLLYWFGCMEPKIMHMVVGTGIGAGKLESSGILDLDVNLPPLEEQKKIAATLSVWDSAIEKMEKLIEAKESQKKSLITKLIVFSDDKNISELTKIKLSDIFDEVCEKNRPDEDVLTIIQGVGTVLRTDSGREIIYDKNSLSNYKYVKKGDFIIHLRSFESGLEVANQDGIVSPAYIILRPKIKVSTVYLYSLFHTNEFINRTIAPAVEGARDGRSVKYDVLKNQTITLPNLSEQQSVARLLLKADEELSLLKQQLENYKKQKQGLMQKLLTGQWRVK